MKNLIIHRIKFGTCYHMLILNAAILIASFVLYPIKLVPQGTLQITTSVLALFLSLYIQLGYIKYSFIKNERQFQQIIMAAIVLSTIQSLLIVFDSFMKLDSTKYTIGLGIIGLLAALLFYSAFGLIKNDEMAFFKKLSRLNLYLPSLLLLGLLLYFLNLRSILFFIPIALSILITAILLWYWQIRLFRYLSLKYNKS